MNNIERIVISVESLRDRWSQFKKKAETGNLVYVRLMSMLDDNISRYVYIK